MSAPKRKRKKTGKKLSVQQQRFVENILKGETQTVAYLNAGYKCSAQAAKSSSSALLTNPNIAAAIKKIRDKANKAAEITQTRILEEESRLAFYDPGELFDGTGTLRPIKDLPDNIRRAIHGLEVIKMLDGGVRYKYRFHEKGRALERLERIQGMFAADKIEGDITISWQE